MSTCRLYNVGMHRKECQQSVVECAGVVFFIEILDITEISNASLYDLQIIMYTEIFLIIIVYSVCHEDCNVHYSVFLLLKN